MSGSGEQGEVTRRALVVAAGAALLAGCGGDDEPPPGAPQRPRRRGRRRAEKARPGETLLAQGDLDRIAEELTARLEGDDLQAFLAYARPSDTTQWQRMWEGLHTVPTTDRAFWLQSAGQGWANRRGGPVSAVVRGVVSYRVEGCDAQPMAHLCDLTVFKATDGRVRVQTLGPLRDEGAAPWLFGPVAAVTAPHVVLVSRSQDAATARRVLADVERGVVRAMGVIPPASGISRICVTLGWPEARDRLYGGSDAELVGSAHNYRYVDPQELADTGRRDGGGTSEGARVVVEPGAMSAQGAEAVTAHEAVHALAFQWGPGAPPLFSEGLARFVELGGAEVERAMRRIGADGFRAFARRLGSRSGRRAFTDPLWIEDNYTCAAMTCAHVAQTYGEARLLDLVRTAYEGSSEPVRRVLGMSQGALLREVTRRLRAEERSDSAAGDPARGAEEEPDET